MNHLNPLTDIRGLVQDLQALPESHGRLSEVPSPRYPLDAFPDLAQRFVRVGATARGIPVDFVATPLLGFVGAAVGNRVRLQLKRSWDEHAVIWAGVIGGPGTGKSPGQQYAARPLRTVQAHLKAEWDGAMALWDDLPPEKQRKTPPPSMASIFTTNVTLDAVAPMLSRRNGLAVEHDELAGWTNSFDAFRKGGDRQTWLGAWGGSPFKVDRKTSASFYVENPVVCVVGGVQPERLPDLRGSTVDDGFADRFLLSMPVATPQGWTESDDDEALLDEMGTLFTRLANHPELIVVLSRDARQQFQHFVNSNTKVTAKSTGLAAGWSAKAPRHLARIALVLHVLDGDATGTALNGATMEHAIRLLEHYRHDFVRAIPLMGSHGSVGRSAGNAVRVARYLRTQSDADGWVARSVLMDKTRLSAEHLTEALIELREDGLAESRVVPTGAVPRDDWRWLEMGRGGNSENSDDCPLAPQLSEFPESSREVPKPLIPANGVHRVTV